MDSRLLRWAYLQRLHEHFRTFFWLHPWANRLSMRMLVTALREGHLFECTQRPWLVTSPALLYALRGYAPTARQWKRLQHGPAAHESLIHRTAAHVLRWPGARLRVDEGVHEPSKPGAWGAIGGPVADIEVRFDDATLAPFWIECERNFRRTEHYRGRLQRIRSHLVIYVVHHHNAKSFLTKLFEQAQDAPIGRRIRILTESEWRSFAAGYGRKLARRGLPEGSSLLR